MPDGSSPEIMSSYVPEHIGAVFQQGRDKLRAREWVVGPDGRYQYTELVPVLDIRDADERNRWCLENMRVFADGTVANPEKSWKPIVDSWLTELKVATTNTVLQMEKDKLSSEDIKEFKRDCKETELDIKAMMAVSASARAMEISAGSAAEYAMHIAPPKPGARNPDLDKQDTWVEFLLHKDPGKLNKVINNPLIKHYHDALLKDAGINNLQEWRREDGKWQPSKWEVDRRALEGNLKRYLTERNSFDEYISDVLLASDTDEFMDEQGQKGLGDTARWAAAKLACDAFLVDKYTRWELALEEMLRSEEERAKLGSDMKPTPGWGGDPLRAVLEPTFLPRRIKKMYQDRDGVILKMMDNAFRPRDIFRGELEGELLPASMVVHLKNYARYSDALWAFLGGSRANGIPQWTKETMGDALPSIAELLDQVYGTIDKPKLNTGKHIVGAMMARILECKALAVAMESTRPGFKENLSTLFDPKTGRPFLEAEQFIWGPNLDAKMGFLASLASGRTRFVFKNNDYGAETKIRDTWELLSTNDQDPKGRGRAKTLNMIGFVLDSIQAIAAGGKKR